MSEYPHASGNGAGGAHHAPGAEGAPPVDFTSLIVEDIAEWLGGHVDKDCESVWFPHPYGDGDYAKCRVSQKPDAPYGVDLWVSEGDKQEVLDYIVELLNLSKVTRKLTKAEKAAQAAVLAERRKKRDAARAYNLGKAKADHWDGAGLNFYAGTDLAVEIDTPAQPVTADGPACVLKYLERRGLPSPDEGVIRFKPATFIKYGPSRKHRNGRTELWEPAHIVALTRNALTGAEEGVHLTYIDDEGNGITDTKGKRKRTWASSVGVIKWRTVAGAKRLVVSEGWENAGSAMRLPEFDGCDIWSTSSGFGLQQLPALAEYDEITVIVDLDKGKGKEASEACAKRWHYARKRVCLLKPLPPPGREENYDLNDIICAPDFAPGVGYVVEKFTLGGGDKPSACTLDDFVAYMPAHNYIYKPTCEHWPAGSVCARLGPMPLFENGAPVLDKDGKQAWVSASAWLDINQPVEQTTWAPGEPQIIHDRLISVGGWFDRPNAACFNQYRPPTIKLGDPNKAGPWIEHAHKVYSNDADHIIKWLAQRRQHPEVKINHSLFLGGDFGIGKDSLLEPVKRAVGPWNFREVKPKDLSENFTPFVKAVILRISEAHDLGDVSRYSFYDTTKDYIAAPPDVLTCNEKHLRHYYVPNIMGVILTSNHKEDGIFLPANDRRHYVAWSDLTKEDFPEGYWNRLWGWYYDGGFEHVAAYLDTLDISDFDPKAPPPKTPAFFAIVQANCAPEESELADVIEGMGNPAAFTLQDVVREAFNCVGLYDWLTDRKNRRAIPHRMKSCDYVSIRNGNAKDGLWKVLGKRQVIYGRKELTLAAQLEAAQALIAAKEKEGARRENVDVLGEQVFVRQG